MNRLRWLGVLFGWIFVAACAAAQSLEMDEQTLKNERLPIDGKGLIEYFEKQTIKEGDAKILEALVRKLRSSVYTIRESGRKELVLHGRRSLPFLRGALTDTANDVEAKRLAAGCIEDIEAKTQNAPISAAARVLAARKEAKAAEVLFNFLPSISEPYLEEDVLGTVGRLTITADKVDPLVLNALKDPLAFRRYTAAYLVGRRASTDHREKLRELLADKDALVSKRVAEGLFGKRPFEMLAEALAADEKLLKDAKIETTEPALLKWFRDRTPNADEQKKYRALVKALGSEVYPIRLKATKKLEELGVPALPFLKEAEFGSDIERATRIRDCMETIRGKNNPAVPIAAAHLLARPAQKKDVSPAENIRVLLAYVPFADDDAVEEEVLTCLTILSLREPAIEPDLIKALDDRHPTRRAAAAYVLGHVGTKEQLAKVHPLLSDLHPMVRLRAAQGLLAARDKAALPGFVSLLSSIPTPHLPKVEEILYRLAEDKAPTESIGGDGRDKTLKAWKKWLADNQATIDLTRMNDTERYLGLLTICEYDNLQFNQNFGSISEAPRNGPKRWSFAANGGSVQMQGPMDAHTLPNGRVLVAENSGNRITERDSTGKILWEYAIPPVPGTNNNPVSVQRLPNGNTFIASYNMVMEIRADKSIVYRINSTPANPFHIFSAHKARNGNIVMIGILQNAGNQGAIIEMDIRGQRKRTIETQTQGNWCSVESMPNGNYLVATMNPANIRELDPQGKEVWRKDLPDCHRATRLPNGNILACQMNSRQVLEIERPSGNIRWTLKTNGRPWAVHYR